MKNNLQFKILVFLIICLGFCLFLFFPVKASADYDPNLVHLWNFNATTTDVVNGVDFQKIGYYRDNDEDYKNWENITQYLGRINSSFGSNVQNTSKWVSYSSDSINYEVSNAGYSVSFWFTVSGVRENIHLYNNNDEEILRFYLGSTYQSPYGLWLGGANFFNSETQFVDDFGIDWVHITITVDSSNVKVYANGEEVASVLNNMASSLWKDNGVKNLKLSFDGWTTPSYYHFDDIAFWAKGLNSNEALNVYNYAGNNEYDAELRADKRAIDSNFRLHTLPPLSFNIEILEDPLSFTYGQNKIVNFSYNFCDNYNEIEEAYLNLGYEIGEEGSGIYDDLLYSQGTWLYDPNIIGPQLCQGSKQLIIDKEDIDLWNNDLKFVVFHNLGYDIYNINYTFEETGNYLESGVISPLEIDIDSFTGTTTIIAFNYNFEDLDWEDSEVCLNNVSSQASTGYCATITSDKGYGLIQIPIPEAPSNFKFYFQSSISNNLKSNSFFVNFISPVFENYIFKWTGKTNEELACSEEEWNTPDPVFGIDWLNATTSVPAFNLTKLKCKTITSFYNTTDNITGFLMRTIEFVIEQIKTIFPFNIPAKVYESWKNSENKNLPEGLSFLEQFDENNNISLNLGALTGTTTNEIIVFGPDIIENDNWTNLTQGLKEFFKYLFWALFIYFAVYKRGERIYYRLKDEI